MQKRSWRYSYESTNDSARAAWQLHKSIKGKKRENWVVTCFLWWKKGLVKDESWELDPELFLLRAVVRRDSTPWIYISNNFCEFLVVWQVSTAFFMSSGLSWIISLSKVLGGFWVQMRLLQQASGIWLKTALLEAASYTKQSKCSTFWWSTNGNATPVLSGNQEQSLTAEVCESSYCSAEVSSVFFC